MINKPPRVNEISPGEYNKCIQLTVQGKNYLRFAKRKDKSHSGILFNTLTTEFKITPRVTKDGIISPKGRSYELVGAGRFDKSDEKIILYGNSFDYQIGPNEEHAQEISKLTGLEIIVK